MTDKQTITIEIPAPPEGWVYDGQRNVRIGELRYYVDSWSEMTYNTIYAYPCAVRKQEPRELVRFFAAVDGIAGWYGDADTSQYEVLHQWIERAVEMTTHIEIAKLREENQRLMDMLCYCPECESAPCTMQCRTIRQAKIEVLREAREQLSQDCLDVTKKYQNSNDPHERANAGWASYAHGFLRCRLDLMIKKLEGECDPELPPDCFFTEIGGWYRVRTKQFNWYYGRQSGAEEIGAGNSKEEAAKDAWRWWEKYAEPMIEEGKHNRRNWSANPLCGEKQLEGE